MAKVNFTGGEQGGRAVSEAAARRFAKVTAELGGKTPVIVFDDADLSDAVNGVAFGGFVAAGQTWIAGSRLLVQETIYDAFVSALAEKADAIRVGDPNDPAWARSAASSPSTTSATKRSWWCGPRRRLRLVRRGRRQPVELAAPSTASAFRPAAKTLHIVAWRSSG